MENVSNWGTVPNIEDALTEYTRPFREAARELEEQRRLLKEATEAVEKYTHRAKVVEFAWGLFSGMAGGFLFLSGYSLVQGNHSLALGFLGPALAALVGVWGFRISRFTRSESG